MKRSEMVESIRAYMNTYCENFDTREAEAIMAVIEKNGMVPPVTYEQDMSDWSHTTAIPVNKWDKE